MRANLQELAKMLRPVSDAESRALAERCEAEAGTCDSGFVAAEHEMRDEYWTRAEAIEHSRAPTRAFG